MFALRANKPDPNYFEEAFRERLKDHQKSSGNPPVYPL